MDYVSCWPHGTHPHSNSDSDSGSESDLCAVIRMAGLSFGPSITEHPLVKKHLPAIVDQLALQSQSAGPFSMKTVHSLLLPFGVNIKGMRKHEDLRMFVEAAFLLLALRHGALEDALCTDTDALLQLYPSFAPLDAAEQRRLLAFRNFMAVAVRYIPPQQNRDYLLDLITRLAEGGGVRHVPGSGATLATRNRIDIYRREGCVHKKPRVPRRSDPPRRSGKFAEEAPPEYTASLKRGRSLDEGGALSKRATGDGGRVWTAMQKDQPIVELFDLLQTMELGPWEAPAGASSSGGRELSPDELDAMLVNGHYPDPPGFLAGYKGAA